MKRVFLFLIFFCPSIFWAQKDARGVHVFSVLSVRDSITVYPDSTKPPIPWVSTTVPVAQGNNANSRWLNGKIRELANFGTELESQKKLTTAKTMTQAVADYQKRLLNTYQKMYRENHLTNNSYDSLNVCVIYNAHDVVILEVTKDYFETGMLHAFFQQTYSVLDVKHQKQLKPQDVFTAEALTLQKLIEKNFRKQYNLSPSDSLSKILRPKVHLTATPDFYAASNGINFHYVWSSVAFYRDGPINVTVPYNEIRKYIPSQWKKRLEIPLSD